MAQAQILYAGTEDGLRVFSNPGRSQRWLAVGDELQGQRVRALACASDQPLHLRVATETEILLSNDGGQTWHTAAAEQQPDPPAQHVALAGQPPALLRIAGSAIERSEDGQSWQPAQVPTTDTVTLLLAAPYHPDTAFAGTTAGTVLISTDRGRSWQVLAQGLPAITALAAGRAL